MVDLISFGGGNLGSMTRALERLGQNYQVIESGSDLTGNNPVILPGVGAFGSAMAGLDRAGLTNRLRESIKSGTPYLGVCIGMQLLFPSSDEAPDSAGLGLVKGNVARFRLGKVPQIGWNRVEPARTGIGDAGFAYFVNSFYCLPADDAVTWYHADYHIRFCAALRTANITAFQFHPEKSSEFGYKLLREWLDAL